MVFLTRPAVSYHYWRDPIAIVWSLWRHQQSIVMYVISRIWTQRVTRVRCANIVVFIVIVWFVLSWRTVYALNRVLFWCLIPSLLGNSGNKHQNYPLVSAWTVRHSCAPITLHLFIHVLQSWFTGMPSIVYGMSAGEITEGKSPIVMKQITTKHNQAKTLCMMMEDVYITKIYWNMSKHILINFCCCYVEFPLTIYHRFSRITISVHG